MRFPGWTKVGFDAEMDLDASTLKPASAALIEFRRFLDFDHAEQSAIELSRLFFFAGRHGQLHVVDRTEREIAHSMILSATIREQTYRLQDPLPVHSSGARW